MFRWLILFFTFSVVHAQSTYNFRHYGVKEGLASMEVYHSIQDKEGYLWFCTDNGISRFDGHTFKNYSVQDGLSNNVVFRAFQDDQKRIWFVSSDKKFNYILNGKIHAYAGNEALEQFFKENTLWNNYPIQGFVVQNDSIWFEVQGRAILMVDKNYQVNTVTSIDSIQSPTSFVMEVNQSKIGIYNPYNPTVDRHAFLHKKRAQIIQSELGKKPLYGGTMYISQKSQDRFVFGFGKSLFLYDGGLIKEVKDLIQSKLVWLYEDQNGGIWTGEVNEGLKYYPKFFEGNVAFKHYLKNSTVSCVFEDHQGNYWITTTDQGVFMLPRKEVQVYEVKTSKVSNYAALQVYEKQLYIGSVDGMIFQYHSNLAVDRKSFKQELKSKISIYKMDTLDGALLIFSSDRLGRLKDKKLDFWHNNGGVKSIVKDSTRYLLDKARMIISVASPYQTYKTVNLGEDRIDVRPSSIIQYQSEIFVSTNDGLFRLIENQLLRDLTIMDPIHTLSKWNDNLLIGTQNNGLFIRHLNGGIDTISIDQGLNSSSVKIIHVQDERTIWIGSNKGLNQIVCLENGEYQISSITINDGLSSQSINALECLNDTLWVATDEGLNFILLDDYQWEQTIPMIHFTGVEVNGLNYSFLDEIYLPYDSNFINIAYTGIDYRNQSEIVYHYQIPELSTAWKITNNRNIPLNGLSAGAYTFRLKAKSLSESEVIEVKLIIQPPFWLTWWFWLLMIITIAAIIYYLLQRRYAQMLEKSTMEKEAIELSLRAVELEQKALRSQMNPHFIFNALNSIYSFVLGNESEKAAKFLVHFSKLIRHILDSSRNEFIALEDEISMLKYYMELEQLQKEQVFNFVFTIDEEIDQEEIFIPSMIIQPYIENAIIHGVRHLKDRKGRIEIKLRMESEEQLICEVIDNGIGRTASMETKIGKSHHSVGIKNTKERIELLRAKSGIELSIEVVDLGQGTKVQMKLPTLID